MGETWVDTSFLYRPHPRPGPDLRRLEDHRPGTQGGPWVEIYQKISRGFQWIWLNLHGFDTHRIHGAAIYANMDPINRPQMLAYIYQHHGSYGIWFDRELIGNSWCHDQVTDHGHPYSLQSFYQPWHICFDCSSLMWIEPNPESNCQFYPPVIPMFTLMNSKCKHLLYQLHFQVCSSTINMFTIWSGASEFSIMAGAVHAQFYHVHDDSLGSFHLAPSPMFARHYKAPLWRSTNPSHDPPYRSSSFMVHNVVYPSSQSWFFWVMTYIIPKNEGGIYLYPILSHHYPIP